MQEKKTSETNTRLLQSILSGLIIFYIFVVGCSPQKRLDRLIQRHPELVKIDTTIVHDTTIIETTQKDTVFKDTTFFKLLRDTIVINNDRLTIRQYHSRDSIFIEGECKGDTLYKEIPVPYQTVKAVTEERTPSYIKWLIASLIIICILAMFRKR